MIVGRVFDGMDTNPIDWTNYLACNEIMERKWTYVDFNGLAFLKRDRTVCSWSTEVKE